MQKIDRTKAAKAIHILTQSFQTNPSALWVIKQNGNIQNRLRALICYAIKTGLDNDGVFLSDDETAAAICFEEPVKTGLKGVRNQLVLINKAIGISRVPYVLKREAYLKKHRPNEAHLNFWFLGVDPSKRGSRGVYDLKQGIFKLSKTRKLPILIETSVERNKCAYERFGFEVYHTWQQSDNYTLWFMRRNPS